MDIAKLDTRSRTFGSPLRTDILILLALLDESYPRELARLTRSNLSSVQRIVDAFDTDGLTASRNMGRERRVAMNPRYFAARELRRLLDRLAEPRDDLRELASSLRRRPRRARKPI